MLRKTLTILSLTGLLLSLGAWAMTCFAGLRMAKGNSVLHIGDGAATYIKTRWRSSANTHCHWKEFDLHIGEALPDYYTDIDLSKVHMPFWVLAVMFGGFSIVSCRPFARRHRRKLGLCINCGYDLRASNERCPECGEEFGSTGVGR